MEFGGLFDEPEGLFGDADPLDQWIFLAFLLGTLSQDSRRRPQIPRGETIAFWIPFKESSEPGLYNIYADPIMDAYPSNTFNYNALKPGAIFARSGNVSYWFTGSGGVFALVVAFVYDPVL